MRILLVTAVLATAVWFVAATPVTAPELYDVKQLKNGMVLDGESVFDQEGLKPFKATVLAVMPDFLAPGEDLILVRLSGEIVDRYGVVNGMSGSPLYFKGKLVGAVSYRFGALPKEPIAGVTPAESMLALLKERKERPKKLAAAGPPRTVAGFGEVQPIAAPLVCGGCTDEALAEFAPKLAALGFAPVRGSGSASNTRFPMFAGGPVGSSLVEGDVSMSALGTITYINGNDVVAFGHPSNSTGDAEVPMATAEIFSTIPSLSGGHKLGRSGAIIGAWTDDRLPAIGGRMGLTARTVPFRVTINRPGDLDAKKDLAFNVVDDTGMGAALTDVAVASAIMGRTGAESIGTVTLKGAVTLLDGTIIPIEEKFSSVPARNPVNAAASMVGDIMESLWRNAFERVRFKDVQLTVTQDLESHIGMVVKTVIQQPRIHAGETIKLRIDVRTHREGLKQLNVELPTDATMEPGYYWVAVADELEAMDIDREAAMVTYPRNIKDLIKQLQKKKRGDRLYVYLLDKVKGARVDGQPMAELPPSMQAILNDGMEGGPVRKLTKRSLKMVTLDPGVMVLGEAETQVHIAPPRGK